MHLNFNNILIICFIFIAFINGNAKSENKYLAEDYITNLLLATEQIQSTNIIEYQENIDFLEQHLDSFTEVQLCFFKLLLATKNAIIGEFDLAKEELNNLFDNCQSISSKVRIKTSLANFQAISNEYEKAINNLDYAIHNIQYVSNNDLKYKVYTVAAMVYRMINQNRLSFKFSQLIVNENPDNKYLCFALDTIIRLKISNKVSVVHDSEIKNGINICEKYNEIIFANLIRLDWYKYQLEQANGDIKTIKKILTQLQRYTKQIDDTQYSNLTNIKHSLYTIIYNQLANFPKMLKHAEMTLKGSKSIGNTVQKLQVLDILINHYRYIENYQLAFKYLLEKNNSKKLFFDDEQAKIMAFQTVKHNNVAKTQEIKFLSNKNKLMATEARLASHAATNQKLIISFLATLIAFIMLWGFKTKKVQKNYKHLSETDSMTGIYNRKGLNDFMEKLLLESKKTDETVAYAIFDLDCFKNINDKYGHMKGDWVIKKVIQQCQLIQNNKTTFGRIGGEEFAIIMRDSNSNELSEFAEKCRKLIANIDAGDVGCDFTVSASFGVTSTDLSGYALSNLMKHADEAMYDAKTAGRNMVVNYQLS